jgi:hypothetical protein
MSVETAPLSAIDVAAARARVDPYWKATESRTGATPVPHGADLSGSRREDEDPQVNDLLEDDLVSPEGIDPDGEAEGRSRGADAFRGETRPSEARDGEPNVR